MFNYIKFSTICFLTLIVVKSNAQSSTNTNTYTSYNQYFGNYDILIFVKKTNNFQLDIYAHSADKLFKTGGITINKKQHQTFLNAISEAKIKYEEWVKVAKGNNVKQFYKSMTIENKVSGHFNYGSNNYYDNQVNLSFSFNISGNNYDETILYSLTISTGRLQSDSNQFIEVDGFEITFSSTSQIDEFMNAISKEKITEFLSSPKKDDIFKD